VLALQGFLLYNSCITEERLREKGVLLKDRECVCVEGGMCKQRLYLVGMVCPGSVFIVMLKQECQCCVMKAFSFVSSLFPLYIC